MAASKKYGYQLRGDKLSLFELDVTGAGSGLNYSYSEDAGLGISTDATAWKSPLEAAPGGIQIEYLPAYNKATLLQNFLPGSVDFIELVSGNVIEDNSFFHELADIWVTDTSVTPEVDTGVYYSSPSSLKITHSFGANLGVLEGGPYATSTGAQYTVTFKLKIKQLSVASIGVPPTLYIEVAHGDKSKHAVNSDGTSVPSLSGDLETHPAASRLAINNQMYTLDTWVPIELNYTESFGGSEALIFITSIMMTSGSFYAYYIDDFSVRKNKEFNLPTEGLFINLPSYAQKALLDYVRAQEAYEGGDLEKWNFFMKQFRSKLERWEDSRITGPRVLGPHGPSSIT